MKYLYLDHLIFYLVEQARAHVKTAVVVENAIAGPGQNAEALGPRASPEDTGEPCPALVGLPQVVAGQFRERTDGVWDWGD